MPQLDSVYLLKSIEDVNSIFIIDPFLKDEGFIPIQELPRSEKAILNSWKFYELEYPSNEDFEKFTVSKSNYNKYLHGKIFSFKTFERKISKNDFEHDVQNIVDNLEKRFLASLKEDCLNSKTDFKIKIIVKKYIDSISESRDYLKALKTNDIQNIVVEKFVINYTNTLKVIAKDYKEYYSLEENSKALTNDTRVFGEYFFDDNIIVIKEFEQKLIDNNFIEKVSKNWLKRKINLVDFCRLLIKETNYVRPHVSISDLATFFGNRYSLDIREQRKKNKYEKRILIKSNFHFLFE